MLNFEFNIVFVVATNLRNTNNTIWYYLKLFEYYCTKIICKVIKNIGYGLTIWACNAGTLLAVVPLWWGYSELDDVAGLPKGWWYPLVAAALWWISVSIILLLKWVWVSEEAVAVEKSAGWCADEIDAGEGWWSTQGNAAGACDVRLEIWGVCGVTEDKSVASGVWPAAWW